MKRKAREIIEARRIDYNETRPHSSLNGLRLMSF
ncbi:MAG: transposase [Endomicrobium sp.]|nr:transposase [Endomicrobium sp.]